MTDTSIDTILAGKAEAPPQDTPPTEAKTEPEQSQDQPGETAEPQGDEQGQKMVPHAALHAEKQKVKRYTEQVASFEEQLKAREEAWERRFGQLLERLQPQQPPQPPQPVDWYTDPDAAFRQNLERAVSPLEQTVTKLEHQLLRMNAVQQFGADKVKAFESYVTEALQRQDPDMGILSAQMRASPDPMATGIKWLEAKTFDPEKERERLREEERKKILEEMQTQQPQTPTALGLPSNLATARNVGTRAGPAWSGPPPLQDIFKR